MALIEVEGSRMTVTASELTRGLLDVCRRHVAADLPDIVFPEPYVPYVPVGWNGWLVVGEAQNLSSTNSGYVTTLKSWTAEQRMTRLFLDGALGIGVQPWDDGCLPLALLAAFPDRQPESYAVSNAVPWSCTGRSGENANPSEAMILAASAFWAETLPVLRPHGVVAAGDVAHRVFGAAWKGPLIRLRLPSPRGLASALGLFDDTDLLKRFPEVARAMLAQPPPGGSYSKRQVIYACHVVSMVAAATTKP